MDCPPVLFLIFNRSDLTQQSFAAIRDAKPPRLFVAADGPRDDKPGELALCEATRKIATSVDWPCEVQTLFRDRNLGCGKAVSEAITWFFEHVDEGIILEDDCVANASFFTFSALMLERYRDDSVVMAINGTNHNNGHVFTNDDYYFSKYLHPWGWASWKRCWDHYDYQLNSINPSECIDNYSPHPNEKKMWMSVFERTKTGHWNTWDNQFMFCIWAQQGLTVTPRLNLVANVGFDERATHTFDGTVIESYPLNVTGYAKAIRRNISADEYTAKHFYKIFIPTLYHSLRFLLGKVRRQLITLFRNAEPQ